MPTPNAAAPAKPWYSIKAKAPIAAAIQGARAAAEIMIYGDIGEDFWGDSTSAMDFVRELNALQVDRIDIRINSYGGSVKDGVAIANAIERHPAEIHGFNDGLAASIASLILMSCDRRVMAENSMLMIHGPHGGAYGTASDMDSAAIMLRAHGAAMATTYSRKSGKPLDAVVALLDDNTDHWFTAEQALADGWVDQVGPENQQGAQARAAFDLSRFKNVPAALLSGRSVAAAAAAIPPAAPAASTQEIPMTQTVNTPAATPTPAASVQHPGAVLAPIAPAAPVIDAAAVLAQDGARRAAIRAAAQPFMNHAGFPEFVAGLENDHAVTEAIAGQRILARLGQGAEPVAAGRVVTVADETDKRREAIVNAMLIRAGHASDKIKTEASANPFRGRTLLAIAEASLQAAGLDPSRYGDKRAVIAAAFTQSSSDFPILLENVMHKTLLSAYGIQALTWQRFCKRGTVSDFRAHSRYRVGSLGNLQAKNELGEYKNVTIPDGEKSTIAAATKGFMLNISREAIINDDLGALTDQAAAAGRAAARTVEVDVYAALLANAGMGPTMQDGQPLFHASHNNIAPGAAISVDSLDAMRVLMAQQKDVSGNDFLDLRPEVLLVPIGMGGSARVIIGAEYDTSVSNKFQVPNKVRGLVRDIVDSPRLSGTRHYLLASSMEAPALEVAFLDGNDTPYLETAQAFDTDGGKLKVRLDYGVAGHDFRGAVTNAGA